MRLKLTVFMLMTLIVVFNINAQSNNTITIQGNTYYFRSSTTPSSAQPTKVGNFYDSGKWYGEEAAKTWASLADWAIEQCLGATVPITSSRNETVYISAIYIYKKGDTDYDTLRENIYSNTACIYDKQIRIDYWVVKSGSQMADGRREKRWFGFQ